MSRALVWLGLPALLIAVVLGGFLALDPLRSLNGAAPPVEQLTVERTVLDDDGIALHVRAGGSAPLEIVQLQVDGAYWSFVQEPPGPLPRLATAWLRIPYPWVLGETHHLVLLSTTGVTFEHTIDVALPTPELTFDLLGAYGLVGVFVGVVPVALGMLFFPALRAAGGRGFVFALALTVGLLLFLLVDTMEEALELAAEAAPELHVPVLVWLIAALTAGLLLAIGRRRGGELSGVGLAAAIALGIGLHNLGEGLAIGSAFATGAATLGAFLVLGFTLHNITEGVGIVAPMLRDPPGLPVFAGLALLAGLPAVLGVWLGLGAITPHWAALALAVGAGAILQVVIEVGRLLLRQARADGARWLSGPALGGVTAGIAVMFATALLVQI
jgi:zinc transporter, ZIP family